MPVDARWWYVFGSATLAAFILQVVTGVALAFSYVPSAAHAYDTLQFITHDAVWTLYARPPLLRRFGHGVDGGPAHGASVSLWLLQVSARDELGHRVLLLGFTLVMGFTGQLLRWDQTGAWSVVVAANRGRVP